MKIKKPVKAYCFGSTWEIRDRRNVVKFRFMPLSGDIIYKQEMIKATELFAKLINDNFEDIPEINTDLKVEEVVRVLDPIVKPIDVQNDEVGNDVELSESVEVKKQRGRPKGWRKNG